ncbi:MAG: class I SAM-dependent methyltransferase [Candidatus Brocadiaceae bacterium]|nr:class I SAM-dependent methyltransferase [Candidatus Brocadiaceae bacterium]
MSKILGKLINNYYKGKKTLVRHTAKPSWHNLRSVVPISRNFGSERGTPVGRYYIEKYLSKNREVIRGDVLEVADSEYTKKFGTDITSYDVLHYDNNNRKATIIGDLTDKLTLPKEKYDCFICTQTFNHIYHFREAIKGSFYVLKEGGVLLATVGGLIQISRYDMDRWGDYWRFTTLSLSKLFSEVFGEKNVVVDAYGNVLSCIAILEGMASEELAMEELDYKDDDYQLIISITAKKTKA